MDQQYARLTIFLSHSKARSRAVAEALHRWLPKMFQTVDIWFSDETDKGVAWDTEINQRLAEFGLVIVVLTPENQREPWLNYEAGAFNARGAPVMTLLLDMTPGDVDQPLARFQHTMANKEDVYRLLKKINTTLSHPRTAVDLEEDFELRWPELEHSIASALSLEQIPQGKRDRDALLLEIFETVRMLDARLSRMAGPREIRAGVRGLGIGHVLQGTTLATPPAIFSEIILDGPALITLSRDSAVSISGTFITSRAADVREVRARLDDVVFGSMRFHQPPDGLVRFAFIVSGQTTRDDGSPLHKDGESDGEIVAIAGNGHVVASAPFGIRIVS